MIATKELKKLIKQQGFTLGSVSERLGISRQSFSYKINNKLEFRPSEIEIMCDLLGVSDKDKYFFAK